MNKKYYALLVFAVISLVTIAYAQKSSWSNEEIKKKTPEDIVNDPVNARQHWDSLSQEQREKVYKIDVGLKTFPDLFAAEKGLKSLFLSVGLPKYDGTNLENKGSIIPVSALKKAEVTSLKDGGFEIKFPENTNLGDIEFNGGLVGIRFVGNNLEFKDGLLKSGVVTIYNPNHIRIGPDSVFVTNNLEFKTKSTSFDLYDLPTMQQNNFIQLDKLNHNVRIVGDDISVRFLEGNQFNELLVNGRITVIDGSFSINFDGYGNAFQDITLGKPRSKFRIIDESAEGKAYVLVSDDESAPADEGEELGSKEGHLEGYDKCGFASGYVVFEITGRAIQSICKEPLVKTGESFNTAPGFPYKVELFINKEQIEKVKEEFILKQGREPKLENKKDLEEIGKLINRHVTDLKIRQTFLTDKTFSTPVMYAGVLTLLGNSNVVPGPWDVGEIKQLVQLAREVRNGDSVEYQLNAKEGLITAYPKNAPARQIQISRKILDGLAQNFYNPYVNSAPDETKNLLKPYFASKTVALK